MFRDETEISEMLARVGAVIKDGHIVYASGKHGSAYVNKDAIYPHTRETSDLCYTLTRCIADKVRPVNDIPFVPQAVIAPAVGGVILSQWTAYHFSGFYRDCWIDIPALYADKVVKRTVGPIGTGVHEEEYFELKRGYDKIVSGKRVLVVEDVLNTGGSVVKTIQAVRNAGGEVVVVGALCNRGGVTAKELGVPYLVSLLHVKIDAWSETECPLCAKGVPINTSVGHGSQFLSYKYQPK